MGESLRAAVIGVGYLGTFHAMKYQSIANVDLKAVVDIDQEKADTLADKLGTRSLYNYEELLDEVDLVSVVAPAHAHHEIAANCIKAGVHVFIEKPITTNVADAESLIKLAEEHNVQLQVGHLERFNPAFVAAQKLVNNPLFIESHRLAPFKARGLDVDVILDLMIHDIDLILTLVNSPVVSIESVGTPVLANGIDIANTRLKFANGCIANVTASRVSQKSMRVLRLFQHDRYLSLDLDKRKLTTLQKTDGNPVDLESMALCTNEQTFENNDLLLNEIESFLHAVRSGESPVVTGEDAKSALAIALEVSRQIEGKSSVPSDVFVYEEEYGAPVHAHPNG